MEHKTEIKEQIDVSIPMTQDLERRNEELEELYLLEGCFPKAEKLKRDDRLLSQVRLILFTFLANTFVPQEGVIIQCPF